MITPTLSSSRHWAGFTFTVLACLAFMPVDRNLVQESTRCMEPFESCGDCHKGEVVVFKPDEPGQICSNYCQQCHSNQENHHPVDRPLAPALREKLKKEAKLSVSTKNTLLCGTCHHINKKRFDDQSWKAQSAFDRMFKRQSRYRTYFLVERNHNGQLCKHCH